MRSFSLNILFPSIAQSGPFLSFFWGNGILSENTIFVIFRIIFSPIEQIGHEMSTMGTIVKHTKEQKNQNIKETSGAARVRLNMTIVGQPTLFLRELRQRGLAVSNHDAIVKALFALEEQILSRDLRKAELEKLKGTKDESLEF